MTFVFVMQSTETQWQKVNLLLEFAEWLYCHNFPKSNAQNQVQWAIDILLHLEPEQTEAAGRTHWFLLFIVSWLNWVNDDLVLLIILHCTLQSIGRVNGFPLRYECGPGFGFYMQYFVLWGIPEVLHCVPQTGITSVWCRAMPQLFDSCISTGSQCLYFDFSCYPV